MANLFIFGSNSYDNDSQWCLLLDSKSEIVAPMAQRSWQEIRQLQENNKTVVVLPSSMCGFFMVELPKLDDRKAQLAIPYAIEEELAQPVDELHFSCSKKFYDNGNYLVVVIDKLLLQNFLDKLHETGILCHAITTDWFALDEQSLLMTKDYLQVRSAELNGCLTGEAATMYLDNKDGEAIFDFKDLSLDDEKYATWVAKRLLAKPYINISQGKFANNYRSKSNKIWQYLSLTTAAIWLICFLGLNLFNLFVINQKITDVDRQIATIYYQFFPQAKKVVSPRFRFSQLLSDTQENSNKSSLWKLLDTFASSYKEDAITLTDFRYHDNTLSLTLRAKDFAVLENFRDELQKSALRVKQSQATSEGSSVSAVMELKL